MRTSPCGNTAVRLNGAAMDSTGRPAYSPPASASVTTSVWTWLMKSRIGVSLYRDSAADSSTLDWATTRLTYSTVLACWPRTAASTAGSSTTVLVLSVVADLAVTVQRPFSRVSVKSIRVSRWPHFDGSEVRTRSPVVRLVTNFSGTSLCAWPNRIASMPGTCSAISAVGFSFGSSGP